jgi:hypothetical protein
MWEGGTDQVYFVNNKTLLEAGVAKETLDKLFTEKLKNNKAAFVTAYVSYQGALNQMIDAIQSTDATTNTRLGEIRSVFATGIDAVNADVLMQQEAAIGEIFDGYRSGLITGDANQLNSIAQTMNSWEDSWSILPLNVAMDFIKDDNNMVTMNGNQLRVFPCKGFTLPVNTNNALSSGIIKPTEKGFCSKTISFTFDKESFSLSLQNGLLVVTTSTQQLVSLTLTQTITTSGLYLIFTQVGVQFHVTCPNSLNSVSASAFWNTTIFHSKLKN